MNKNGLIIAGVVGIVVVIGIGAIVLSGDDSDSQVAGTTDSNQVVNNDSHSAGSENEEATANSVDSETLNARYIDYSDEELTSATAEDGRAVLFFAALDWCTSCQAADRDFKANFDEVPTDVSILKVDYDNDSAMKRKYNIVGQDTFIQVEGDGTEIVRWNSGGRGVDTLLANVQ